MRLVRQDEQQRRDDVRRLVQHDLPFGQRFADQPELVLLQIAQTAVDQLRAPLRRCRREIAFLDDQNRETPPGRVASDARTVDSGADDEQVVLRIGSAHAGRSTGFSRSFYRSALPRLARDSRRCATIAASRIPISKEAP